MIALIVLAAIAANRRAIGHAASAAVHVLEVSGAPARTCGRSRLPPRILFTR